MQNQRKPGLDLIRIFSALLVIICHSGVYFSIGFSVNFVSFAGVIAVEFFFVLSGFLVGKSLIQTAASDNPGENLKRFYVNRLFRILPLYYFALILTALVTHKSIPLSCFVFLQNFRGEDLAFLSPSWSLSVEAWFYFLVPPLFCLLVKALRGKMPEEAAVWTAVGILCIVSFALRTVSAVCFAPQWDEGIRKQIPLRLDSIGMGMALAVLKRYHPESYRGYFSRPVCAVLSVLGIWLTYRFFCGYLAVDDQFDASALCKILMFSLWPALCCVLVGFLDSTTRLDFLSRFRPIRWLSDLSYGVYLMQLVVFRLVSVYFVGARFAVSWLGFLGAIALTNVLSAVTYVLIEKPMQKLGGRLLRQRV